MVRISNKTKHKKKQDTKGTCPQTLLPFHYIQRVIHIWRCWEALFT
jgi:hypothetical protein